MTIEYTYKVISVDAEQKNMMMEFSADGYETTLIGTRLPHEGESVADVAAMYSPVRAWEIASIPVVVPEVGHTGKSSRDITAPPTIPADEMVKGERDVKLLMSDWTQMPDAPLTPEQKALWATYRQALRDVPEQAGFPDTIDWPVAP